jgi:hypothetical protein
MIGPGQDINFTLETQSKIIPMQFRQHSIMGALKVTTIVKTMTTIVNTMTNIVTYNRLGGTVPGPASHGRRHRSLAVDPHLHHLHQSQPTV